MHKKSSSLFISKAVLSCIILRRDKIVLGLSLHCFRERKLGYYSYTFVNRISNRNSLSMSTVSVTIFNATISKFEILGATSLLKIFWDSLTKLPVTCLHKNLENITYKLYIRYLTFKAGYSFLC